MTIHLSILIFWPLVLAVLGGVAPRSVAPLFAVVGAAVPLGYAIIMVADFEAGAQGLQYLTDDAWIDEMGIRYTVGIDGLNLWLVALTALLFAASAVWVALRPPVRAKLFAVHFGIAETAVLGAFVAQDLALFVLFFDLMLVPFYFLLGQWGGPERVAAAVKMVVYTLVGSLLMLAAAVATAVLASGSEPINFSLAFLQQNLLGEGTQKLLFAAFALAFLIKMPSFPFHGWMPDAYRNMPLPVLAVFSGVVSKVAAYGFLRIALPLFPEAVNDWQLILLVLSLLSIVYGSVQAFTQTNLRLILGYSSIAQLGFITLGIFALDPEGRGAQGALLQAVNHGLVVAPLFLIGALLAARAAGSDDIRDMGGIASRAPVLTTLFLIVTLATLAMPGSANFVGEFFILLGVFESKLAVAIIASTGVILASVYALRLYIRSMHNRQGPAVTSFEMSVRDGLVLVPLVLAVLAFAVYPQLALEAGEPAVRAVAGAVGAVTPEAPKIDWEALSPLIALAAGACIVLLVGLLRGRFARRHLTPALTLVALGATAGLGVWQWGVNTSIIEGALAIDDLTLALTMTFVAGGMAAVLLSWRSQAAEEAGEGEYYALLLSSMLGMVVLVGAQNLVALFLGFELLSIPLYVLCATHMRREHSLESGLKYLIIGSVGSATLLYGLAFLYGATGSTDYSGIAAAGSEMADDVLFLTGIALVVAGLAFKASVAPFHQWTPDVYEGAPTPITGFMAVATKAAAFGVLLRLFDVALIDTATTWGPALATLAAVTIVVGNVGAIGQSSLKRLLAYSSVAQAGYMLAGVVVSTRLGVQATVFYLFAYTIMNLAAFAVIVARERESPLGDDIASLYGLGAERPWLAWPMTIAMLGLAGLPATVGFFGKLYLIEAAVDNEYGWLGAAIVIGSAISLVYYLRVIAAVWMRSPSEAPAARVAVAGAGTRPAIAGGSGEGDAAAAAAAEQPVGRRVDQLEVIAVAVVSAAATIVFGIYPEPLFELARDAGAALGSLV